MQVVLNDTTGKEVGLNLFHLLSYSIEAESGTMRLDFKHATFFIPLEQGEIVRQYFHLQHRLAKAEIERQIAEFREEYGEGIGLALATV